MLVEQGALMHIFRKRPGFTLIGACVQIRTNTVGELLSNNSLFVSQLYEYKNLRYALVI